MIPGWQQAVRHSLTQLKPGGSLHLVDFGTMDAWPGAARNMMRRWLAGFHVEPRTDLGEQMARLAADNGLNVHLSRLGGGYAVIASIGPSAQPASRASAQGDGVDWFTHAMQP
jgi:S-adenosylmethionine-diacylgycerolhomoserine-N-methlytransferase